MNSNRHSIRGVIVGGKNAYIISYRYSIRLDCREDHGRKKGGFIRTIITGIAGSFVGSAVISLVGFHAYGFLANVIVSVFGACIFLFVAKKIFK